MPVVAPCLALITVHALLYDRPFALVRHEETVQVEIEAVLHRGAVDLCHQPTRPDQRLAIEPESFAKHLEFFGRAPGMFAASTADVNAKFALQRREPPFQRADDTGGNSG